MAKQERVVNTGAALLLMMQIMINHGFQISAAVGMEADRHPLPDVVPHWAVQESFVGQAPPSHPVHIGVYLSWRNQTGLEEFAQAVSSPGHSLFGKYLTPEAFHAQYSPIIQSVNGVSEWLQQNGFRVVIVAASRKQIIAEGTVEQAEAAFGAKLGMYAVRGHTLRAPSSVPSLPLSLVGLGVATVTGLDQGSYLRKPYITKRSGFSVEEKALETQPDATDTLCYFTLVPDGNSTAPNCGYRASQIRTAYGVPSWAQGEGQSVAIIAGYASPFIQNDLNTWARQIGENSTQITSLFPDYTYTYEEALFNPAPGYNPGWQTEENLDIETVHGIAPKASIFYIGAASTADSDLIAALAAVLDFGLATIVTNSYGSPLPPPALQDPATTIRQNQPWTDILIQAAAQGVGVYFASGDSGDDSPIYGYLGYHATDYPASDPWAIAVGGTSLGISEDGGREFEVYWGSLSRNATSQTFLGGGGGGISVYGVPFYQEGSSAVTTFLDAYGNGVLGRVVPDISGNADPTTGYFIGLSQIELAPGTDYYEGEKFLQPVYGNDVYGGTSLSCPMMAAFIALAQEVSGRQFGFINPLLYSLPASAFVDITVVSPPIQTNSSSGSTLQYGETLTLSSVPGYDDSTGLGVPSFNFWSESFWNSLA